MSPPFRPLRLSLPDRVHTILASRGQSLAEVSRCSQSLGVDNPLHHIPHNFYSALRDRRFSPSLYQVLALSILSGYSLVDWLTVFGFSLEDVPRFQASLPALRTMELDAAAFQAGPSIPWVSELKEADFSGPLIPVGRWLASTNRRKFDSLSRLVNPNYRYVKIGSQDAFAFPELLPGSIVRVDPVHDSSKRIPIGKIPARTLFLVEYSGGMALSRLYRPEQGKVVLCSRHLPYAPVELEEGKDCLVSGIADFELRSLRDVGEPVVPTRLGRFWLPAPFIRQSQVRDVGEFIRRARKRSGLSFREASERTKLIARKHGDCRYYCAPGSLSDYETRKLPPRHIHKLISICAVYFASAVGLLEAAGAGLEKAGKLSMPTEFLSPPASDARPFSNPSYLLADSLSSLFGLQDASARDVFWAGGIREASNRYTEGAVFLVVDRKRKIPKPALSHPKWAQPIYILQERGGGYLCGFCILQNGTLILRSCFAGTPKLQRLRNQVDAEVVGKVVGIARRLRGRDARS